MTRSSQWWELAACGAAAGGAGVLALAAAARVGWLRLLLDLYPKSNWDQVTWVLIPVLMALPLIAQGTLVAAVSAVRPLPTGRGIAGSVGGSLLALILVAAAAAVVTTRLSGFARGPAGRMVPLLLILGCGTLLIAGGMAVAARRIGSRRLRGVAVPLALAAAAAAWLFLRAEVVSASVVLDRAEVAAFFLAVASGGGAGSAWNVCRR